MLSQNQILALHLLALERRAAFSSDNLYQSLERLNPTSTFAEFIRIVCKSDYIDEAMEKLHSAENHMQTAARLGVTIVSCLDAIYPARLKKITNPPLVLFVKGDLSALHCERSVAVVGSRDATSTAVSIAHSLAKRAAERRTCIVSGLAKGCDAAAHLGALACPTGQTVAVMAHGLDKVYPAENRALADRIIASRGALVSIYPFGVSPNIERFYDRNGIQTGLSDATVIVQAAKVRCGTMATAAHCRAQRRILFCINHKQFDPDHAGEYKGNAKLISEGVRDITPTNLETFTDTLDALLANTLPMFFRARSGLTATEPPAKRAKSSKQQLGA